MKKAILGIFLAIILVPSISLAADIKLPDSTGNISVSKEENYKNLYAAGGSVEIRNDIKGDFVSSGGNIAINGNIEKGVLLAGGNININGEVGQSARIAGGNIFINGKIKEDLVVFGGTVRINKDATIDGDLIVFGGQVMIDGKIGGSIRGGAGEITLNSEIGKDVLLSDVGQLTINEGAVIGGNLNYTSTKEAKIAETAKINGERNFKQSEVKYHIWGFSTTFIFLGVLIKWVSIIISLLLIIFLFPKQTTDFVNESFKKPLASFGWGVLSLICAPIISILLISTVLGASFGFALIFAYITLILIASPLSCLLIGSLLLKQLKKKEIYQSDARVILTGSLVFIILSLIPIFGWAILGVFFFISFGQLIRSLIGKMKIGNV